MNRLLTLQCKVGGMSDDENAPVEEGTDNNNNNNNHSNNSDKKAGVGSQVKKVTKEASYPLPKDKPRFEIKKW